MPNTTSLTHSVKTMTSLRLAAASIAAGASLLSFSAPDAHAQSFVKDIFGDKGACDEGFVVLPGVAGGGRDCSCGGVCGGAMAAGGVSAMTDVLRNHVGSSARGRYTGKKK